MSQPQIALRYARALHDAAQAAGSLGLAARDMAMIDRILAEVPHVRDFCLSREQQAGGEAAVVETAFLPYLSPLGARLVTLLQENRRLSVLPLLPAAWDKTSADGAGVTAVLVETAGPADSGLSETIRDRMEARLGHSVRISERVNPELKGGFRIQWNNRLVDASIAGRLRQLRRLLKHAQ